jgi:Carboxypeptidase regulatory-like domain
VYPDLVKKSVIVLLLSVAFVTLAVSAFTVMRLVALKVDIIEVDCGRQNSFTADRYRNRVVFVATVRDFGVAEVRENFQGLQPGTKHVLIAHWGFLHSELKSGRTYYVEGRFEDTWLSRFLPVVNIAFCSRSGPVNEANLDLRILRESAPPDAARIVGEVRSKDNHPKSGAKISIKEATGDVTVATDSEGIFELTGLPPGHYEVQVPQCDESKNPAYFRCAAGANLVQGSTWGVELRSSE